MVNLMFCLNGFGRVFVFSGGLKRFLVEWLLFLICFCVVFKGFEGMFDFVGLEWSLVGCLSNFVFKGFWWLHCCM